MIATARTEMPQHGRPGADHRPATDRMPGGPRRTGGAVLVKEFYWGLSIRSDAPGPLWVTLVQSLAWALGIVAAVLGCAVLLVPVALPPAELLMLKGAGFAILIAIAGLLFDFARQGTEVEIEVDMKQAEVREVIRRRVGPPRVLSRHGFDALGGVYIQRGGRGRRDVLMLRIGNTARVLSVAEGPAAELEPLRDRLGRELILRPRQRLRQVPA